MSGPIELVNPGTGPQIDAAESLEGGSRLGWQKLVAHSQLRLALHRCGGDLSNADRQTKHMAKQAKTALKEYQEQVFTDKPVAQNRHMSTNDQLRKDEWKVIDDRLSAVARDNTLGIDTLRERGLTEPLDLGVLRFEWEDISDFDDAEVDMAAGAGDDEDTFNYTNNGIPLPIVHKSFRVDLRKLRASRRRGQSIDTAGVEAATAAVARKIEDILYGGNSITVEGDSISGMTGFTDRQTVSANESWDNQNADNIIDDTMRTLNSLEDARALPGETGYDFFIHRQSYQEARGANAGTDDKRGVLELLRNRLEQESDLPNTIRMFAVDRLSSGNAAMVKPSPRYLQLPMPADIQTVQWEEAGGMVQRWKVMGAVFPAFRSDQSGNSGVAHLSGI